MSINTPSEISVRVPCGERPQLLTEPPGPRCTSGDAVPRVGRKKFVFGRRSASVQ